MDFKNILNSIKSLWDAIPNNQTITLDNSFLQAPDKTNITDMISIEQFDNLTPGDILEIKSGVSENYVKSQIISIYPYTNNGNVVKRLNFINVDGDLISKSINKDEVNVYIGDNSTSSGGMACFTGETLVNTPSGLIPIESLKVGDEVISFNDNTREYESKKITKCLSHFTNEIYLIYLNNEIIRATYDHPMSTIEKDKVLVKDLKVGDVLVSNKEHKEILDIKTKYETVLVYDIGVEDNNNYFIGESNILVYSEPITIKS